MMNDLGNDYDLPVEAMTEWSESYQRGYICKRLASIERLLGRLILAVAGWGVVLMLAIMLGD